MWTSNDFSYVSAAITRRLILEMKSAAILVALFLLILAFFCVNSQNGRPRKQTVLVSIPGQGKVLGRFDRSHWGNQLFMRFMGIPYAESPKGELRFKAPIEKLPWNHIWDATQYGRRCPVITSVSKMTPDELKEDLENCLNLCVYTKNLTQMLPVMFYIYGGGFYNGTASDHPPRFLLEQDIVLVVPQYRIGAIGWLSTLTSSMPGNAPVKDLILALRWVQQNIRKFGGDPENVTIFSQSAGAAMAGTLLLSKETPKGIFKRAIMQSGSILARWAINKEPQKQAVRICKALGCVDCNIADQTHRCLSQTTVPNLLRVTMKENFSPVVGDLYGVLPQQPMVLLKNYSSPIPIMMGFTRDDGSFVLAEYYDKLKEKLGNLSSITVRQFAEGIMEMEGDSTRLANNLLTRLLFSADLLESYDHKIAIPAYFDLASILFMKSPAIALCSHLVKKGTADVYFYTFDYNGENSRFGYEFGNEHYPFNGGIHHSNDNIYLFPTMNLNPNDTKIAKKMVSIWTSFATNGVPSTENEPILMPMKDENGPFFHINKNITIANDILKELTATTDDPEKTKLVRHHIEF